MNIEESNGIIREAIYNNMTNNRCLKNLDEFGYFKYLIYFDFEKSHVLFGFKSEDFQRIFEYSGKDCLSSDFAGFEYDLNVNMLENIWSIVLHIDVSKYSRCFEKIKKDLDIKEKEALVLENEKLRKDLEVFANNTASLFAKFRVLYYTSAIKKVLIEKKAKKHAPSLIININSDNLLYVVPSGESVLLYMGINFGNKTDISLAKVILQETEDSKRHIRGVVEAKNYFDPSKPPSELSELEKDPKRFSCGFICFSKYLFNLDLPISNYHIYENKLGYFINFRSYILYHIHSMKAYLHIRMNKKFQELEKKLNSTKIVSDDYMASLETQNFYAARQKKEDDLKLFVSDFKKVNI